MQHIYYFKHIYFFISAILISSGCFAQDNSRTLAADTFFLNDKPTLPVRDNLQGSPVLKQKSFSPYSTSFTKEAIIIGYSLGVNFLGFHLIKNKKDLTLEQLNAKSTDKLFFMDKWNAGFYSEKADKDSYILFNGSYIYPLAIMLLDKKQQKKFGQLFMLYAETIGITGSMYTLKAGLVYRSRPFVYGTNAPLEKRLSKGAQRSFYGGHVSTTAALSFFTAKVFNDFHPGSNARPYVWTVAAILPAIMVYERYKAGYHFLSDSMLSYAIGAATGYLVPHLHKNKNLQHISLKPAVVGGAQGLALVYKIK